MAEPQLPLEPPQHRVSLCHCVVAKEGRGHWHAAESFRHAWCAHIPRRLEPLLARVAHDVPPALAPHCERVAERGLTVHRHVDEARRRRRLLVHVSDDDLRPLWRRAAHRRPRAGARRRRLRSRRRWWAVQPHERRWEQARSTRRRADHQRGALRRAPLVLEQRCGVQHPHWLVPPQPFLVESVHKLGLKRPAPLLQPQRRARVRGGVVGV